MPDRINHLAVWTAAIAYYLLGAVWYGVLFGRLWTAMMAKYGITAPVGSATTYIVSFVLGLILAYGTAIALTRHPEDQTVSQGISFAVFMGIVVFATQTLSQALYSGVPLGLWLLNTGYVIVGFAVVGAIVGGWKRGVHSARHSAA